MTFLVALGFLLALAVACSGGESSPAARPTAAIDIADVPAFTLNGCTPRSAELGGHGRCDPVNLVFPGSTASEVSAALVAAGWRVETLGTSQVVIEPGDNKELPQVIQLINSDGTTVAPSRYHVRLWELPGGFTVGAVHHEAASVGHEIDRDWEDAEDRVRDDLCKGVVDCEDAEEIGDQRTQQRGSDRWRGFGNDARPSIIRLADTDD